MSRTRTAEIRLNYYIDLRLWVALNGRYIPTKRGLRVKMEHLNDTLDAFKNADNFIKTWTIEISESIKLIYNCLKELCWEFIEKYCQNQLGWYGEDCDIETFDEGSRFLEVVQHHEDRILKIYEKNLKLKCKNESSLRI